MLLSLIVAFDANAETQPTRDNFLILILDDVGVELIATYGESAAPPRTPNIDALAARGIAFTNA